LLYHVIVRGNHRQRTFLTERDYRAYLERVARYRKRDEVRVYGYCLMPNHVHLLLESSRVPLSRFMQGLQQSYTQYFNRVHHKVGHLFQGRYKAILCEKEEYLLELVRYIHLNPVRSKLVHKPEEYRYSGHRIYLEGKGTEVMEPGPVLRLLGGARSYRRFVLDGLGEGHKEEYYEVEDQRFLGSEEFGEKVREEVEGERERVRRRSLGSVVEELARRLKITPEVLRGSGRTWKVSRVRGLVAYVLTRRLGFPVKEVAVYLGRDQTSISTLLIRIAQRMERERGVKEEYERITKIV
jgi:REP element-mobilizing transposase RayT